MPRFLAAAFAAFAALVIAAPAPAQRAPADSLTRSVSPTVVASPEIHVIPMDIAGRTLLSAYVTSLAGLVAGRQADHRRCLEDHPVRESFIFRVCSTDFHRSANDGWYAGSVGGATIGAFLFSGSHSGCPRRAWPERLARSAAAAALGVAPGLALRSIDRASSHARTDLLASLVTPALQGLAASRLLGPCRPQ
jgi:hypothetical protein